MIGAGEQAPVAWPRRRSLKALGGRPPLLRTGSNSGTGTAQWCAPYPYYGGEMMMRLSRGHGANREGKKVFLLEFVAAFAIFSIVAVVLYMVFSYKPV